MRERQGTIDFQWNSGKEAWNTPEIIDLPHTDIKMMHAALYGPMATIAIKAIQIDPECAIAGIAGAIVGGFVGNQITKTRPDYPPSRAFTVLATVSGAATAGFGAFMTCNTR